ncbi:MAG: anti-sigma factor [Burkholderiales bacterium]|nr:anti-sigma factor [Burkholderiales bacterium]
MNYLRTDLIDRLAAEYVLGTLQGLARKRFERLAKEHDMVKRYQTDWEEKLNPLNDCLPPITPPARVWRELAEKLNIPRPEQARTPWYRRLSIWLTVSGLGGALVSILTFFLVQGYLHDTQIDRLPVIALLAPQAGPAAIQVRLDQISGQLYLTRIGAAKPSTGHDFELWALAEGKAPISLGVIDRTKEAHLYLEKHRMDQLRQSGTLAVSEEPLGGSPTGLPTGPVILTGKLSLASI